MSDSLIDKNYFIAFKRDYFIKNPEVFLRLQYKKEKDGSDSLYYSEIQIEDYIRYKEEKEEFKKHHIKPTPIIVTCAGWVKSLIRNYWW